MFEQAAAGAVYRHVAGFNSRDLESLLAGFTDDAVWVTGTTVVNGRAELTEFFARAMEGLLPSLVIENLLTAGDRAACQLTETLTTSDGERTFSIAGFYELRDARIASAKIYREGNADIASGATANASAAWAADLFARSWTALRTAVADVADEDFARPSGCTGWLVRDLVCHLIIDAQDVLITLVTPAETEPTRDAVTYWEVAETPPTGDDPLDALIVRLAAAYEEPRLLKFHLDDVGSAAGRAAGLADPGLRVGTRGEVLTAGDYLSAYVLEWTLHHLDLIANLPGAAGPPAGSLARSREMLERIAGTAFPASLSDRDALLVGTGRRAPTDEEKAALGGLSARLPFVLG